MTNFNHLKNLYEDGYRCIYHNSADNCHTIYLKNFDSEKSETVELNSDDDFEQFKSYMDDLRMS